MKRAFSIGRLLLGPLLIGYLLYTTDLNDLRVAAVNGSVGLLLLAYLIGVVDRILMAFKWNLLLRAQSIAITVVNATVTYVMSTFLGLFLPSTVGGDAIRAFAVSRHGYSAADVASTIVIERALGMLALMTMVVASILVGGFVVGAQYTANLENVLWVVGVAAVLGLFAIIFSFSRFAGSWITAYQEKMKYQVESAGSDLQGNQSSGFLGKVGTFIGRVGESYGTFHNKKGLLLLFFGLSIIENLFPIAWSYTLAMAFQLQVSLLDCFVVVPSVLILRRLPISIDGIGVHQWGFQSLLALVGVPTAQGLLLGITTHLLATALVLPGGLFYMWRGLNRDQLGAEASSE